MKEIRFDSGITNNRIYAHRGDIFICTGLFKSIDEVDKDDHIICKPERPVLIISNDETNKNVVKVLPLSTKPGSANINAVSSGRMIQIPGIGSSSSPSYIDVTQIFTVNTYQLKIKLAEADSRIVDAAVALLALQYIQDDNGVDTVVKMLKDYKPQAPVFNSSIFESNRTSTCITYNPYDDLFIPVKRVTEEELNSQTFDNIAYIDKDVAMVLYKEWLVVGTDVFRHKYGLTKQQYICTRDKCVKAMLGLVPNFKKYDWST